MRPAFRSASIAICLPGIASKVKRALTSEMRPEPFVTTTKLMMVRMTNTTTPTAKLPPMTNSPKDWMTLARRARAAVSVQQHDAGRGDVEGKAQQRRKQEHRRKYAELDRAGDVEHRHDDDDRERDVESEEHIERERRQRQHDHREHGEHPDRHADAGAHHLAERRHWSRLAVSAMR